MRRAARPRVVVAYSRLSAETEEATARYRPRLVETPYGDDEAYWRLLRDLWAEGRGFVLVEQDKVPWPGAVDELWACPRDWCSFEFPIAGTLVSALGCTKFSDALLARRPDAVSRLPEGRRSWVGLDTTLLGILRNNGEAEHVHRPPVGHVHERPPERPRRVDMTRALYVGPGYLNGVPAADIETDDAAFLARLVGSGKYIVANLPPQQAETVDPEPADAPDDEPDAPADEKEALH